MFSSSHQNEKSVPVCPIVEGIHFHMLVLVTIFVTDVIELQLLFIWSSKDPKMFKDSVFPMLAFAIWKGDLICNRYKTICHFAALPKINGSINGYISAQLLINGRRAAHYKLHKDADCVCVTAFPRNIHKIAYISKATWWGDTAWPVFWGL